MSIVGKTKQNKTIGKKCKLVVEKKRLDPTILVLFSE